MNEMTRLFEDINNLRYEDIKDRLEIRLFDPKWNKKDIPEDVVINEVDGWCMYYQTTLYENSKIIMNGCIKKGFLREYGVSLEQLHEDAMESDLHNFGVKLSHVMSTIILCGASNQEAFDGVMNVLEHPDLSPADFDIPLFVLTKKNMVDCGSSLMIHERVRQMVGNFMKTPYFILPSAVTELMIVPADGTSTFENLRSMVRDANSTMFQNNPENLLSDKVMLCSADGKKFIEAGKDFLF